MNRVEDFLGHECILPGQISRESWNLAFQRSNIDFWLLSEVGKNTSNLCQVFPLGQLIEGKRDGLIVSNMNIDLMFLELFL